MFLDFYDKLRATFVLFQHLQKILQLGHLLTILQGEILALFVGRLLKFYAVESGIMINHDMPVGCQPYIGFRAVNVQIKSVLQRGARVLGGSLMFPEASVGNHLLCANRRNSN